MTEKLLKRPLMRDESDDYYKDIKTFRDYAWYMQYSDPIRVELSSETADLATDAVNNGLDIWKVHKALCGEENYDDDGKIYVRYPAPEETKEILGTMLHEQASQEPSNMNKRLYVAYGSNLNLRQMAWRCPTAKLYGTGVIEGYELQFKGAPSGAFATIGQKDGSAVPVAVWEIQQKDEKSLDTYEGFPSHYYKEDVTVTMDTDRLGEPVPAKVDAMVYIMNQSMSFGVPSQGYYNTVYQGYENCGLDTDVLNSAVEDSIERFKSLPQKYGQTYLFGDEYESDYEPEDYEDELEDDEQEEDEPFDFSGQMHL